MMDKSASELYSKGENLLRLDSKTPYKTTLDWEKKLQNIHPWLKPGENLVKPTW